MLSNTKMFIHFLKFYDSAFYSFLESELRLGDDEAPALAIEFIQNDSVLAPLFAECDPVLFCSLVRAPRIASLLEEEVS